jgi:hypothetical protein
MEERFPDLDGIIGLNQENLPIKDTVKTAFGAIGQQFAARFPNKQVFCPEYKRFYLDKELEEYANKIDKLYWCKEAMLIHLHPAYDKKWEDFTHHSVRQHLKEDRLTYMKRRDNNLLWGDTFGFFNTLSHKK